MSAADTDWKAEIFRRYAALMDALANSDRDDDREIDAVFREWMWKLDPEPPTERAQKRAAFHAGVAYGRCNPRHVGGLTQAAHDATELAALEEMTESVHDEVYQLVLDTDYADWFQCIGIADSEVIVYAKKTPPVKFPTTIRGVNVLVVVIGQVEPIGGGA